MVYLVTEINSFKNDTAWVDRFGERMIMQTPEDMLDPPPARVHSFAYLMQFTDGNRIDLTLFPVTRLKKLAPDSLSLLLLDKDGLVGPLAAASESDYLPKPPTPKAFSDCCNEFWWVCPYVAKGLWRTEILYAKSMLDGTLRVQLIKMLTWYVGIQTDFSCSTGKFGKYLNRYLEPELWSLLEKTYSDASYDHTWDSLLVMGDLFRLTANKIAGHFGFDYPNGDDERVIAHLQHVRVLPRGASEIY